MTIWTVLWKILLFGGCVSFVITAAISPSNHDGLGNFNDQKQPSSQQLSPADRAQNYLVSPTTNLQPNPAQKVFARRQTCLEHCLAECQPVFREDDILILVALYCMCRSCYGCIGSKNEHGTDLQRLNQYSTYGYQFPQQTGIVYSYDGALEKAMLIQQMQSFAGSSSSTPIGSHHPQQPKQQMQTAQNDDELKSEPECGCITGDSNSNAKKSEALGNGVSSNSNAKTDEKSKSNHSNNSEKNEKSEESFEL